MKCPNCGQDLSDTARFCSKCGQPVYQEPPRQEEEEPVKICPYCGYSVPVSAQFCNNCGHLLDDEIPEQEMQEKQEQIEPQDSSKKRRGRSIIVILLLLAAVLLAVGAGLFLLKKPSESRAENIIEQPQSASRPEAGEPEQDASSAAQESPQDSPQSQPEKDLPALEQEQPDQAGSAPAIQVNETWGQQEILITPTQAGKAVLTLRQQYQGEWTTLFECEAAIGRNGTTTSPAEGDGKTPAGTFPVLFCYGLQQPQTGIPFVQLTSDSVWVDDSQSMYYNCLTTREQAGDASYEDTYSQFSRGYYSCNIFFANNGDGQTPGKATPGLGSVRVLEGYQKKLEPTNGDIKISAANMETLLGILDAAYNPVVTVSGS